MESRSFRVHIVVFLIVSLVSARCYGQEHIAPLNYNPFVGHARNINAQARTTSLSLPFFDDFTNYNAIPDNSKWVEQQVYINNTMCISPVSRGVATFDVLNQYGIPYDTLDNYAVQDCDSLTSQPIDLSSYTPADSLYLSFFYQPGGNGFAPLSSDSLFVFMRKKNTDWKKVWETSGTNSQPFKSVMLPLTDTSYFYNTFQFRFVNFGAVHRSDAIWNVDYVKLDANRGFYDSVANDIAYTADPSFMLNDYTYMPYRQFMVNPAAELAPQFTDSISNNYHSSETVDFGFVANETTTGTPLYTSGVGSVTLFPFIQQAVSAPAYTTTIPLTDPYAKVIFENKFYMQTPASDPKQNDTIVKEQVFDNYLAYDDGTAELSYYLSQFYSLPAKLAIQYHLNQPDTLRALAIYFGRQVPLGDYKNFSIAVYSALAGVNGATNDQVLLQDDYLYPGYVDTVNHFWVYTLSQPLALPAGDFYAGTVQPAFGISDSLYIGLDANRTATNHAYYNVQDQWFQSQIAGAIMIRPILGQPVLGTSVSRVNVPQAQWTVSPNPVQNYIRLDYKNMNDPSYLITDMEGRSIMNGPVNKGQNINMGRLSPGIYFIRLIDGDRLTAPQKIIKQ